MQRILSISGLLLAFVLLAESAAKAAVGVYFFAQTGHWYEAVQVPAGLTWNEAHTNALRRGGYLCTITNAAENTFVASLVDISYYSGMSVNGDILGPWLGGFRKAGQVNWQWVNGEAFIYSNWYNNQPDGYGGSEQRLEFYARASIGSTWGDHPGDPIPGFSLPRGYVVEYNAPRLSAFRTNSSTVISWPVTAGGWFLDESPTLPANPWSVVNPSEYQTNSTSIFIVRSNLTGNAFYRLRR